MEENYNWSMIMAVSGPIAIIEAIIFYLNIGSFWKYVALIAGVLVAFWLIYRKDRKKSNMFTASAIVFLSALIVKFLKDFGIL